MKRLILLFLAIVLLTLSVSSCKKEDENEGNPIEVNTSEEYYLNTLQKGDYTFGEFQIATIDTNCVPAEISADATVIDQTLFERDGRLEEHFGIAISYHEISVSDKGLSEMMLISQSQEATTDLFIQEADNLMTLAINGYCSNLNAIDTLGLEKDWWSQMINKQLTFKGALYITAGPVSQWYYGAPIAMAFNKDMMTAFGVPDIYGLVQSGDWTLETLRKICTEYGVYSEEEGRYAISYANKVAQYALYVSAGGQFATVSDERGIEVTLGNENSVNIMNKILLAFDPATSYGNTVSESAKIFTDSNALFWRATVGYFETYLPSSTIDYGVIPCPKYDTVQKEYISCGWASSNFCVAIPNYLSGDRLAWSGLFTEAYSFLGYDMLKPVKYDSIVKYQVANDPIGSEMLDIIFGNVYFDINQIANFGGSIDVVDNVLTGGLSAGRLGSAFGAIKELVDGDIAKYNTLVS